MLTTMKYEKRVPAQWATAHISRRKSLKFLVAQHGFSPALPG